MCRFVTAKSSVLSGSPVSDGLLGLLARRMYLLSDPVRVRILMRLEKGEICVQALADELDATRQNVSYHLSELYRDGVVTRRKEGTTVFYAISDFTACRVIEQVLESVRAQAEEIGELAITG